MDPPPSRPHSWTPWHFALLAAVIGLAGIIGFAFLDIVPPTSSGIACEAMEGTAVHIHVQLQLWRDGKPVPIPSGIGAGPGCYYWVHTHSGDGVIHVESPRLRPFTLGDFFEVWGQPPYLGSGEVWVKRQGGRFERFSGSWNTLALTAHEVIAMGTGVFIPQDFTFSEGL